MHTTDMLKDKLPLLRVPLLICYSRYNVTYRGSTIRPTQTSAIVKLRSKSLDGGWSEDSLWRATRIRAFPRNVVMDGKPLKIETNVNWPCIPAVILGERTKKVFCFLLQKRLLQPLLCNMTIFVVAVVSSWPETLSSKSSTVFNLSKLVTDELSSCCCFFFHRW